MLSGLWRAIKIVLIGVLFAMPLTLLLGVRTFLFQPFNVPAESMAPTLVIGDYFFANKFAYGFSQFTPPFGPWGFSGRLFAADPRPGDVVVFASPREPSVTFVKRVVGLAGDRIQMKNGQLFLNGTAVKRERLSDVAGAFCGDAQVTPTKHWRETLPNSVTYETLDCVDNGFYDNTPEYLVPAGYAFVIGDNRDNSTDSRVLSALGYIPLGNIYGRAGMIFYSRDTEGAARINRVGTIVH